MKKLISTLLLTAIVCFGASAQLCTGVWGQYLVNQTFGEGDATTTWYGPLATYAPGASTSTTFVGTAGPVGGVLSDGFSGLAKVPSASNQGNWVSTTDHTGDPNGLMFLINAPSTAATVFFEYTIDNLCPNTNLKLSVWILNANDPSLTSNSTYQYPNMTLKAVDPVTNNVLGTSESGNVLADQAWHQYSVIFNNGFSSSIKLQLVNNSVGSGYGNDLAIDDITVQPCVPESHILPKVDTAICQSATLHFSSNVISSPYNPAEYQWQYSADNGVTWLDQGTPGPNNTTFTFNTTTLTPGTYLVRFKTGPQGTTANNNCVAISDTSIIQVVSFPRTTINETVCRGTAYNFYGRYIGIAGTYDTLVKSSPADVCGTLYTLHLTVNNPPNVDVGNIKSIDLCVGDTTTLKVAAPSSTGTYQWLKDGVAIPGETGSQYRAYDGGDYYLTGLAFGCADTSVRIRITSRPLPVAEIINNNLDVCAYDTLEFQGKEITPDCIYTWSPEKPFRGISDVQGIDVKGTFDESTPVILTVFSSYGCFARDTTFAKVHPCCDVFVPNAFSPNGDSRNDYFRPELEPQQIILSLKIYDRYGKLVYNNSNIKKGWDGKYINGDPAGSGSYMYMMKYTCSDHKTYEKKGDITLIR